MDKHTPGPWAVWPEVDAGSATDRHLVYISVGPADRRKRVTSIGVYGHRRDGTTSKTPNVPEDECRANARLIASAPATLEAARVMLAALKEIRGLANCGPCSRPEYAARLRDIANVSRAYLVAEAAGIKMED